MRRRKTCVISREYVGTLKAHEVIVNQGGTADSSFVLGSILSGTFFICPMQEDYVMALLTKRWRCLI